MINGKIIGLAAGIATVVILGTGGVIGYRLIKEETTIEDGTAVVSQIDHTPYAVAPPLTGEKTVKVNVVKPETSKETKAAMASAMALLEKQKEVRRSDGNTEKSRDVIIDKNGRYKDRQDTDGENEDDERENGDSTGAQQEGTSPGSTRETPGGGYVTPPATGQSYQSQIQYTQTIDKYPLIPDLNLPFDNYMRKEAPKVYLTGEYTEQGVNQFGLYDTSSEAAIATAMNSIFGTTTYTENNVLRKALESGTCSETGAQVPEQVAMLIEGMGQLTEDFVATEITEGGNIPDETELAWFILNGGRVIIPTMLYSGQDGNTAIQWAVLTGAETDLMGNVLGFKIVDTMGNGSTMITLGRYREILSNLGAEPAVVCVLRQ